MKWVIKLYPFITNSKLINLAFVLGMIRWIEHMRNALIEVIVGLSHSDEDNNTEWINKESPAC